MLSLLTFAFKCMCFQVCRPVYAETNIVMIFTPMFGDVNFFINWIFFTNRTIYPDLRGTYFIPLSQYNSY